MSPKQKKLQVGEVEQRGREIKHKKSCEKDWPNKHHMDGYVLFGCYDKHHRKQSTFQGQAIPFPLGYEEALFQGK